MSLFSRPEVTILKESSDAKEYLSKLEKLQVTVQKGSPLYKKIDKEISIVKAGIIGEENILFELKNSGMDLVVLHDICLVDQDGISAQIDFLVITPYVRVFIECKNLFGDIEINNKGEFIRTIEYGSKKYKEGLYSPITQNERHMLVFKNCITQNKNIVFRVGIEKMFDHWNRSLVVLANPKTILNDKYAPKDIKSKVIRTDQLIKTLKNITASAKSSKKEIINDGNNILSMNNEDRKDYLDKFLKLKEEMDAELQPIPAASAPSAESVPVPTPAPIEVSPAEKLCPRCGSKMVLRTAKKAQYKGNQFWGCSQYPKCRYMENLVPDHD
ncbi:MAG: NERD domain-containing protein [Oribacterium sp.]|nr:NERD domain-containing protein [Oribacterium sp.]